MKTGAQQRPEQWQTPLAAMRMASKHELDPMTPSPPNLIGTVGQQQSKLRCGLFHPMRFWGTKPRSLIAENLARNRSSAGLSQVCVDALATDISPPQLDHRMTDLVRIRNTRIVIAQHKVTTIGGRCVPEGFRKPSDTARVVDDVTG